MSHIAIQQKLNGSPIDWTEQVTDARYQAQLNTRAVTQQFRYSDDVISVSFEEIVPAERTGKV